jgi:hypothetical protein
MRFTKQTRILALALPAALLAAFAVGFAPPLAAGDDIDAKIAAMKEFEKKGEEGKCIAAMQELKDSASDARVPKAIKDMVGSKHTKIACAAVRNVAGKTPKDVEFLKTLCNRIEDKSDLYKDADKGGNHELVCAYLDAIVLYKADKGSMPTLKAGLPKFADVVKKFLSTNAEFSTRAIRAYGCIRDKFTMEQLIDWGEQTEARSGGGGGGSKKAISTEARDHQNKAKKVILEVLSENTGKEQPDVSAWRKWWEENAKTFVFPEPADPSAPEKPIVGPTIPEGAEFKDEAYGYTVKRPSAEGWSFIKPDYNGPRMAISYHAPGDEKYVLARAYIEVYNTVKNPPKDVKALVEWVKEKPIKEQLDTHDKEADVKEIKGGGGIEWTCVISKGDGIGIKTGWGTIERRFYLVKFDIYMMWVDAFVRSGAEDDIKAALWKSIEDMTLPPPPKK